MFQLFCLFHILFLGTNVIGAKNVLEGSNLPIVMADSFEDAAQKVVASLKQ